MARIKRKISITVDADLMDRVERLAVAKRVSVSRWIEDQIRDSIGQEELAVKVFTDPVVGAQLGKLVGNPEFLRGVTKLLGEDLSDDQLKLFTDAVGPLVHGDEPPVVKKFKKRKGGRQK